MSEVPVKKRLLEAAIRCVQRKGYAATTARDIAREADANLRSIGYHYGSTRELVLLAISTNWRRWLAPLIAVASDPNERPSERLTQGLALFVSALPANASMVRAWLEAITLAADDAALRSTLRANQEQFRDALAGNLAAAGQTEAADRAAAIIALCDGLVVHFLLYGETRDPEEIAHLAAAALAELDSSADRR